VVTCITVVSLTEYRDLLVCTAFYVFSVACRVVNDFVTDEECQVLMNHGEVMMP